MAKEQTTFSVDNASVQERQVTVRVLTIGTKQVTQTMYKQLVDESVLDDKGDIKGHIWGWVNFHDGCGDNAPHLHVIWDDGDTLKRYRLFDRPSFDPGHEKLYTQLRRIGSAYICAMALEKELSVSGSVDVIEITVGGRNISLDMPRSVNVFQQFYYQNWEISRQEEAVNKDLDKYLLASCLPLTLRSSSLLNEEMKEVEFALTMYEEAYVESYKVIKATRQLFIAVSGVWK